MLPYVSEEAACGSVSFPRFAGEGRDGGQRAEIVCPPPQSSEVRGRLPPTSILPHKWGRKMLLYVSDEAACGSVSFPRFAGEGRDGGQRAEIVCHHLNPLKCEVVCPPSQSSPHKWGRKMLLYVSDEMACGSVSFPRLRGKAGMGGSAQRTHPLRNRHLF